LPKKDFLSSLFWSYEIRHRNDRPEIHRTKVRLDRTVLLWGEIL
jgi:hypothetical protein